MTATVQSERIGIATATLYPEWYPGQPKQPSTDKVRGDLALLTIAAITEQEHPMVVVDGGSSPAFFEALSNQPVSVLDQREPTMSASRREGLAAVSQVPGVEALGYIDAEKVYFAQHAIARVAEPLLKGDVELVIPAREDASLASYPTEQARAEILANRLWNRMLRHYGILRTDVPDFDAWFGPRFFRNDSGILALFQQRYRFKNTQQSGLDRHAPETWPNGLFFPVIAALAEDRTTESVPVPYTHPARQTQLEQNNPHYQDKRSLQLDIILRSSVHFIRYLRDHPDAQLEEF